MPGRLVPATTWEKLRIAAVSFSLSRNKPMVFCGHTALDLYGIPVIPAPISFLARASSVGRDRNEFPIGRVDFWWPESRIAGECDGHGRTSTIQRHLLGFSLTMECRGPQDHLNKPGQVSHPSRPTWKHWGARAVRPTTAAPRPSRSLHHAGHRRAATPTGACTLARPRVPARCRAAP